MASFWDHFGITLDQLWDHFGVTLGSFWGYFGMTLGVLWDHFGLTLGSFWGYFGIILGSLWDDFGPAGRRFTLSTLSTRLPGNKIIGIFVVTRNPPATWLQSPSKTPGESPVTRQPQLSHTGPPYFLNRHLQTFTSRVV